MSPLFLPKVFKVDGLSLDFGKQSGGQTGESLAIRPVMLAKCKKQGIYKEKEEAPTGGRGFFMIYFYCRKSDPENAHFSTFYFLVGK